MLKSLFIQNFVLIDNLDIRFDKGFSVITGETGAGKSIVIGSVGLALGGGLFLFGRQFLILFTTESAVIDAGMKRVGVMALAYCISAFMDCTIAASRGLGKTVVPTVIVIMGSCVFRVIWVYTIFAHFHTIPSLYLLYPCSWTLTAIAEIVYFIHAYKDSMKIFTQPQPAEV